MTRSPCASAGGAAFPTGVVAVLCVAATVIGLLLLASILYTLLYRGIAGLSFGVLFKNTAPAGSNGGLANAIVGTLLQTAVGTAIGTPIGLMVGTYLSEYSAGSLTGKRRALRLRRAAFGAVDPDRACSSTSSSCCPPAGSPASPAALRSP